MKGERETEKKENRKKCPILFVLLILSMFGVVIGGIFLLRGSRSGSMREPTGPTEDFVHGVKLMIDSDADSSKLSETDNTAEQDVAIAGQGTMTIPANNKEVTVDFYNPIENEGRYYLTFELRLYDSGEQEYEVLYSSGLVEPGKHLSKITLSHALEKGVYKAVVHVQPYRMNEEKTLTNNADMATKLIVE